MIFTAWNNGSSGYGFKITQSDREAYFDPQWKEVWIELPTRTEIKIIRCNINKKSFWNDTCRELISKDIRDWLMEMDLADWRKKGIKPPKFEVQQHDKNHFRVIYP